MRIERMGKTSGKKNILRKELQTCMLTPSSKGNVKILDFKDFINVYVFIFIIILKNMLKWTMNLC